MGLHSNPKVLYCFGQFSFILAMQKRKRQQSTSSIIVGLLRLMLINF